MSNKKDEHQPTFVVDAELKINLPGEKSHTVRQLNLDDMKILEINFPSIICMKRDGSLKTETSDIKIMKFIWERTIQKVEGYTGITGEDITKGKKWMDKVPFGDKYKVARQLNYFEVVNEELMLEYFPDAKVTPVELQAAIYTVAKQAGVNIPIIHFFKYPDENHFEIHQSASAFDQKFKNKKVFLMGKLTASVLTNLYNELIIKTIGYSKSNGEFSTVDVPAQHKIKTVNGLFAELLSSQEEFEGNL